MDRDQEHLRPLPERRTEPGEPSHENYRSSTWSWQSSGYGAPAAGIALILVGGYFLLRNAFGWQLNNWWALFILIPALSLFANAASNYQSDGRFTPRVTQALTGATFMTLVASVFLFNLSWAVIWPVFLIIAGLSALTAGTGRR